MALTDALLALLADFKKLRLNFRWMDARNDIARENSLFYAFEDLRKTFEEFMYRTKKDALKIKVAGPGEFSIIVNEVVFNDSISDSDVFRQLASYIIKAPRGPWAEYDILTKLTSDIVTFEKAFGKQTTGRRAPTPPALEDALHRALALHSQRKRIGQKVERLRQAFSTGTGLAVPAPVLALAPGYTTTILISGSSAAVDTLNDLQNALEQSRKVEHDLELVDKEIIGHVNSVFDDDKGSIFAAHAELDRMKINLESIGSRITSLIGVADLLETKLNIMSTFCLAV